MWNKVMLGMWSDQDEGEHESSEQALTGDKQ